VVFWNCSNSVVFWNCSNSVAFFVFHFMTAKFYRMVLSVTKMGIIIFRQNFTLQKKLIYKQYHKMIIYND
jgi:hypothetical protein